MEEKLLKKLRSKFVFTNMLLVFLVLATVFGIVCFSSYNQSVQRVYSELERSVGQNQMQGAGKPEDTGAPGAAAEQQNNPLASSDGLQQSRSNEQGISQGSTNQPSQDANVNSTDANAQDNSKSQDTGILDNQFFISTDASPDLPVDPSNNTGSGNNLAGSRDDQIIATSSYLLDSDNNASTTLKNALSLDDDTLEQAISASVDALGSSNTASGYIDSLNLYFRVNAQGQSTVVAFASGDYVSQSMTSTITSLGAGCLVALLAFFVISFFLAKWALRPVKKAWRQQSQFIGDASHELKTPLTIILANMSILKKEVGDNREANKWIDSTQAEAEDMQELVEQMLELAKAEDDSAKANFEPINFSDLAESTALHFESVAFEHGGELESFIEERIFVTGDKSQLKRLVSTLIDNACKYSDNSMPVKVTLKVSGKSCLLEVSNHGNQMAEEDIAHIFDRFYRADKARTGKTRSFGLGLAIAKEITTSHNGTIDVACDDGLTSFLIKLPIISAPLQ